MCHVSNINQKTLSGIYGGYLLGVKTSSGLTFYDWENLELIRRIEVQPRHIFWNESGNLVCMATDDSYFILSVNTEMIQAAIEAKQPLGDDGLEEAFDVSPKGTIFHHQIDILFAFIFRSLAK